MGLPICPESLALNDAARKAGFELGMTKLQVETCGGVLLRKRSRRITKTLRKPHCWNVRELFPRGWNPPVPGTVILDLAGTEKLFGPPETTACKITVNARQIGFHLRIAIAANPDTAMYAARGFAGITIIPAGDEAKALAPLPVGILPVSPELLEVLEGWGIHTFKALAALPAVALVKD